MKGIRTDLVLDEATIKEIVQKIHSMFLMNTNNISVHFEEYAIQINVYPGTDTKFILTGEPVDVRLNSDDDRWEYIGRKQSG